MFGLVKRSTMEKAIELARSELLVLRPGDSLDVEGNGIKFFHHVVLDEEVKLVKISKLGLTHQVVLSTPKWR